MYPIRSRQQRKHATRCLYRRRADGTRHNTWLAARLTPSPAPPRSLLPEGPIPSAGSEREETNSDPEEKTEPDIIWFKKQFSFTTAAFDPEIHAMKDMNVYNGTPDRDQTDFDLIEEIITEYNERQAASLPGPPPPPAGLLCQSSSGGHRRLRQGPSPPSQCQLVARGTACQPTSTFPQPLQHSCPSREMAHPLQGDVSPSSSSHRVRGSSRLPVPTGGVSSQNRVGDTEALECILQKPKLVVVEEPKERGMRFRYECEGRSAGSILGASSTETNKTQPAIEIQGPIDHVKRVTVTVSLVTKDPPHRPHPHCLVGKDCPNGSGICVVTINPHSNRHHSFANLGIQCVRRKELDMSLQRRRSQNIDPFQTGDTKGIEDIDMNAVRLCFQCEFEWDDGKKDCLSPVVSHPIYDKKATTTSQLKIYCLNHYSGPCNSKTEIFMLCDKVQKDDIEIIFRRGSWKASGEFAQTDVHRQIAIVFKTPTYQDQNITEEVEVGVTLRRLSDQMESEPVTFTYLPPNPDPYAVKRKRKIKSDISFREKPCVTAENASAAELSFLFPQRQTTTPEERLCASQPGASGLVEMCYSDLQDSNNGSDATAILNQLLDIPSLWDMISDPSLTASMPPGFEQEPDVNSMIGNMDINLNNPIFGSYPQDFSHYNDLQFNMLVNESHPQQSDAQDGAAIMVQVKTEEEL
ncbi:transcription factor RelB homolog [Antennarius striatus]|uniref:transcription factor RelB homolog n=1 Tax=Antennarius striatus TaxID=241820 RepID=UPI0035AEE996